MTKDTKITNQKLLLTSLIVIILILTILSNPVVNVVYAAEDARFSDVPASNDFFDEIEELAEKEIINGYPDGTFRPNHPVTRAQAAKIIVGALGLETDENAQSNFPDVPEGNEFTKYIAVAEDEEIFVGKKDGNFGMNDNITRRQIANVVVRAFELEKGSIEVKFEDIDFDDDPEATENIKILASNDIVIGYEKNTEYRPNNNTTRGQFAKIVSKTMALDFEVEAKLEVVKLSAFDDIEVVYGGEYTLPKEVDVTLSNDTVVSVPVTWNDTVNIHTAGTYTLAGILDLSGLKNVVETDKVANINIVVSENKSPELPVEDNDSNNANITIMIDPGHGGDEPGAEYNEVFEMNINLSISKKVATRLESQGYNVVMTRDSDKTVGIYDRPSMANEADADIFVSIHQNAFSNTSVSGIETYYYQSNSAYPPNPENADSHCYTKFPSLPIA